MNTTAHTHPVSDESGTIETRIDASRATRCGRSEVVYGAGKTPEQIIRVAEALLAREGAALITRVDPSKAATVTAHFGAPAAPAPSPTCTYYDAPGLLFIETAAHADTRTAQPAIGHIVVASAGTSDSAVAEEATLSCEIFGGRVTRLYDIGVAGVHRALEEQATLQDARVIIAVAGMEGALPALIAGLVSVPVVAVPTSVGYGAHLEGLAPLLTMLNSCAGGIAVVNIDNGFGAAELATRINDPAWTHDTNRKDS